MTLGKDTETLVVNSEISWPKFKPLIEGDKFIAIKLPKPSVWTVMSSHRLASNSNFF